MDKTEDIKSIITYDYYICVLDFEATCEDNSKWENEVIEFPSVIWGWNFSKGTEKDKKLEFTYLGEFREYCKPLLNPVLTDFCKDLTKIKQSDIDEGSKFPDTFLRHYAWLVNKVGGEANVKDKTVFVTCGAWDLNQMLPKEIKHWKIYDIPTVYHRFLNVKVMFEKIKNKKAFGMQMMLKELDLTLDGTHHSGLDDCKNISKIVKVLIEAGYQLDEKDIQAKDYEKYMKSRGKEGQEMKLNWGEAIKK